MKTENRTFEEIIAEIEALDASAAIFLRLILEVSATWDGLIDRDREVSDAQVNRAFKLALVDLPRNRFYMDHFSLLNPVVIVAIHNWHIATRFERRQDRSLYDISFIIRSTYVDLFTMTAFILGGSDLAERIGAQSRRVVHDEGRTEYEKALSEEKVRREGR